MEFQRDIAPPPPPPKIEPEPQAPRMTRAGGMSFKEALAAVEGHRDRVQVMLGAALVARLLCDNQFNLIQLAREGTQPLLEQLPFVGVALLSYMIVLWFLAARTRDRWGFGMALAIGVLQATYAVGFIITSSQYAPNLVWRPAVIVLTHAGLVFAALKAGSAYPPLDSKKPWIFGFATGFIFVALPWVAVPLFEALGYRVS